MVLFPILYMINRNNVKWTIPLSSTYRLVPFARSRSVGKSVSGVDLQPTKDTMDPAESGDF